MATIETRTQQVKSAAEADGKPFVKLMYQMLNRELDDDQLLTFARRVAKRHRERSTKIRFYDVLGSLIPAAYNDGVRRIPVWTNPGVSPVRGIVKVRDGQVLGEWLNEDETGLLPGVTLVGMAEDARALFTDPLSDYYRPDQER